MDRVMIYKVSITIASAVIGAVFASVSGIPGIIAGIVTGAGVGYYYTVIIIKTKPAYGPFLGALAGLISGSLVHIPTILKEHTTNNLQFIYLAAIIGLVVGAFFGSIGGLILKYLTLNK